MKRIACVSLLICFLLWGAFSISALAASNTYDLEECGVSVSIPEEYIVVTRDVEEDDPNLKILGFERDEMLSMMEEQNLYLDAVELSKGYELAIGVEPEEWDGLEGKTEETLQEYLDLLKKQNEKLGYGWILGEIYQSGEIKFLKNLITRDTDRGTEYYLQYYGVKEGRAVRFAVISCVDEFRPEDIAEIEKIVDTIRVVPLENFGGASEPVRPEEVQLDLGKILPKQLVLFLLYVSPIALYRYLFLKKPTDGKKAKRIAWIYGIVVFVILSILFFVFGGSILTNGVAALLWIGFDYLLLTRGSNVEGPVACAKTEEMGQGPEEKAGLPAQPQGTDSSSQGEEGAQERAEERTQDADGTTAQADAAEKEAPPAPEAADAAQERYCRRCGARLSEGARFCSSCGAATMRQEKQGRA